MIAPASPADPLDRLDLVVDQDAEPADLDRFLDALDRLVERRLAARTLSTSVDTSATEPSINITSEDKE